MEDFKAESRLMWVRRETSWCFQVFAVAVKQPDPFSYSVTLKRGAAESEGWPPCFPLSAL